MKKLKNGEHCYFWSKYQIGRFEIWNIGGKMMVFNVSWIQIAPFPDMREEIKLI